MKTKFTFLAIIIAFVVVSCSNSNNVSYNQTVVDLFRKCSNEMGSVNELLSSNADANAKILAVDKLEKLADSCSTVMDGLKPSEVSQAFHSASSDVYKYIKSDFVPATKEVLTVDTTGGKAELYNAAVEKMNSTIDGFNNLFISATSAQQDFVATEGVKLSL
ncbi:MAG: hypothetical protein ACK5MG_10985 [Bacteroidales bacterium]